MYSKYKTCEKPFCHNIQNLYNFSFKVGSFNYDNTKMRYHTYYLPKLPNSSDSILDFKVRTHCMF